MINDVLVMLFVQKIFNLTLQEFELVTQQMWSKHYSTGFFHISYFLFEIKVSFIKAFWSDGCVQVSNLYILREIFYYVLCDNIFYTDFDIQLVLDQIPPVWFL